MRCRSALLRATAACTRRALRGTPTRGRRLLCRTVCLCGTPRLEARGRRCRNRRGRFMVDPRGVGFVFDTERAHEVTLQPTAWHVCRSPSEFAAFVDAAVTARRLLEQDGCAGARKCKACAGVLATLGAIHGRSGYTTPTSRCSACASCTSTGYEADAYCRDGRRLRRRRVGIRSVHRTARYGAQAAFSWGDTPPTCALANCIEVAGACRLVVLCPGDSAWGAGRCWQFMGVDCDDFSPYPARTGSIQGILRAVFGIKSPA